MTTTESNAFSGVWLHAAIMAKAGASRFLAPSHTPTEITNTYSVTLAPHLATSSPAARADPPGTNAPAFQLPFNHARCTEWQSRSRAHHIANGTEREQNPAQRATCSLVHLPVAIKSSMTMTV